MELLDSLVFGKPTNFHEGDLLLFYYILLFLVIFLLAFLSLLRSYQYYSHSSDLKSMFKPLLIILISFTLVSFINLLDIIIYFVSNKTKHFIFLIPFIPVILVLIGSKGMVSQIIHRSKKDKKTFKFMVNFLNLTLVVYVVAILIITYGTYIDPDSPLPLLLAILAFLINETLFILIILLLKKQRSEISSVFSKTRLMNLQIGYVGLIIYFLTLTIIFMSTSFELTFIFINLKAISSIIIILGYYWAILIPRWQESKHN